MGTIYRKIDFENQARDSQIEDRNKADICGKCSIMDLEFPAMKVYNKSGDSGVYGRCSIIDLEFPPVS